MGDVTTAATRDDLRRFARTMRHASAAVEALTTSPISTRMRVVGAVTVRARRTWATAIDGGEEGAEDVVGAAGTQSRPSLWLALGDDEWDQRLRTRLTPSSTR